MSGAVQCDDCKRQAHITHSLSMDSVGHYWKLCCECADKLIRKMTGKPEPPPPAPLPPEGKLPEDGA